LDSAPTIVVVTPGEKINAFCFDTQYQKKVFGSIVSITEPEYLSLDPVIS